MTSLLIAVAFVAAALAAWALTRCQHLRRERDQFQTQLEQANQQSNSFREALSSHQVDLATARANLTAAQAKAGDIEKAFAAAQTQLREAFDALAGQALAKSNEQFLQMATQTLKTEQTVADKQLELRKKEIEALVAPVKETLEKYNKAVADAEKARTEAYGNLTAQITRMTGDQRGLREETARLVQALRRPEVRGRWGEVQLRRVVELAGMIPHCDFSEQVTVGSAASGGGALRPDMVINLPSGRSIVVDSKTPLDAFLAALEAPDETQRCVQYDRHCQQIEDKVKALAAKGYREQFERSPDFVVLFIPGESFLAAAVERRPSIIESAMEKGVVIATPTTLISLLKAVALGWREERVAEHAQKISELGKDLHSRIAVAFEHLGRLGSALGSTVTHYNKLVGSIETQLLPQSRRFKELGADSPKELPAELDKIDTTPRTPAQPELVILVQPGLPAPKAQV